MYNSLTQLADARALTSAQLARLPLSPDLCEETPEVSAPKGFDRPLLFVVGAEILAKGSTLAKGSALALPPDLASAWGFTLSRKALPLGAGAQQLDPCSGAWFTPWSAPRQESPEPSKCRVSRRRVSVHRAGLSARWAKPGTGYPSARTSRASRPARPSGWASASVQPLAWSDFARKVLHPIAQASQARASSNRVTLTRQALTA